MNKDDIFLEQAIIRNINRQKMKVNNSKEYTIQEKELLIKGLNMAIDRVNMAAFQDDKYRELVGLPPRLNTGG